MSSFRVVLIGGQREATKVNILDAIAASRTSLA
jgi:hypothetical protein